jgi:hypothetical protein
MILIVPSERLSRMISTASSLNSVDVVLSFGTSVLAGALLIFAATLGTSGLLI